MIIKKAPRNVFEDNVSLSKKLLIIGTIIKVNAKKGYDHLSGVVFKIINHRIVARK